MKNKYILILLLLFIVLSVALKIAGIIDFEIAELIAYVFLFTGISITYSSFLNKRPGLIFAGSFIFLIGTVIYISTHFFIWNPSRIFFPSLLIITGVSMLLVFYYDTKKKFLLIISLLIILAGVLYLIEYGKPGLDDFIYGIVEIIKDYWAIVIVSLLIIFLLNKQIKQEGENQNIDVF